jgi:hypothetical protein
MTKRILNEKEYWNISYKKRLTDKIRSVRRPLDRTTRNGNLNGI